MPDAQEKAIQPAAREIAETLKDHSVLALEVAKDVGSAALAGMIHVAADTTSHALQAADALGCELASVSTSLAVKTIRSFQEITGAFGTALLESARGAVRGFGLLSAEVDEVSKRAGGVTKSSALGLIHGTVEVSSGLGAAWKSTAQDAVKGVGALSNDLVAMTRTTALDAIQGSSVVALSLEDALMGTARAILRDVREVRAPAPAVDPSLA